MRLEGQTKQSFTLPAGLAKVRVSAPRGQGEEWMKTCLCPGNASKPRMKRGNGQEKTPSTMTVKRKKKRNMRGPHRKLGEED